jgi:hypothetical protein
MFAKENNSRNALKYNLKIVQNICISSLHVVIIYVVPPPKKKIPLLGL